MRERVAYQKYTSKLKLPVEVLRSIELNIGSNNMARLLLPFTKNAVFFTMHYKGQVVGYWWCSKAEFLESWYITLGQDDVVFFSAAIFQNWRGRGIAPAVFLEMMEKEIPFHTSVYLDIETWNKSAKTAWEKAGFVKVGKYPPLTGRI